MNRLLKFISSRAFAVYLIAAAVVILIISAFFQHYIVMDQAALFTLRYNHPVIYTLSKVYNINAVSHSSLLLLGLLIFISLLVCLGRRIGVFIKNVKRFDLKNDIKFLGSFIFHAGMIIVVVGAVVTMGMRHSFNLRLTQGHPAALKFPVVSHYKQKSAAHNLSAQTIILNNVIPAYSAGKLIKFVTNVSIDDGTDIKEFNSGVNKAINYKGMHIVPVKYGFSPVFNILDNRKSIFKGNINLSILGPDKIDSFSIALPDKKSLTFYVRFFPYLVKTSAGIANKNLIPKNPVFFLTIKDDKGRLYKRKLKLYSDVSFSHYAIRVTDIKYWVSYNVSDDPGMLIFMIGGITGFIGLVLRYGSGVK